MDELQRTEQWWKDKLGYASASMSKAVMAKGKGGLEAVTRAKYRAQLVAEIMTGNTPETYKSDQMDEGIWKEPMARNEYQMRTGYTTKQVGFIKHDNKKIKAGCSPDDLVKRTGGAEYKCPEPHTHMRYILEDRIPPEYRKQIDWTLWITKRKWWDFVSYCPEIEDETGEQHIFIKRTWRNEERIQAIEDAVVRFMKEVMDDVKKLRKYKVKTYE